jgi:hypothetical protein
MDQSHIGLYKDHLDFGGEKLVKEMNLNNTTSKKSIRSRLFGPKSKNKIIAEKFDKDYVKPGDTVGNDIVYTGNVSIMEQPDTLLDNGDYQKRLKFAQLKQMKLEAMC